MTDKLVTLAFVSLLLLSHCTPVFSNDDDKLASLSESERGVLDTHFITMDSILQDLLGKYDKIKTDSFWHPNDFGTGSENREVIRVSSIAQQHIPGEFLQWKVARLGLQQNLVGLTPSSIKIYGSKLNEIAAIDLTSSPISMEVFTKWDSIRFKPTMILLVATSPEILVLSLTDENTLEEIGSLPLNSPVKSVMVCQVDNSEKVVLVPDDSEMPINIYNVDITPEGAQLWFFQRITESGVQSALVHRPDTVDSMLILSTPGHLNVYHFNVEQGQFSVEQSLPFLSDTGVEQGCSDIFSFTLMYQHYIGCMVGSTEEAEREAHFISYNYNMNEYEDKMSLKSFAAAEVVPVDIEGTRNDLMLMTRDAEGRVNVLTHNGQNNFHIGHECTLDACKNLEGFTKGANFMFEDTDAFVFPSSGEGAPVISFMTETIATSSPVFEQSMGLFGEFKRLSNEMDLYRFIVSQAVDTLSNKLNTEGDNEITGSWTISTITTQDVAVEDEDANSEGIFNVLRFAGVDITEKDFTSSSELILGEMGKMEGSMGKVMFRLNDALLNNFDGMQTVSSDVIVTGQVSAEELKSGSMNVATVEGQDVNEFFQNLANKQEPVVKVNGGLVFSQPLRIDHLHTNKINQVLVEDLAVLSADNVFTCETTFATIKALDDIQVKMVNGFDLLQSVVMASDVTGFHFTDGIVAYQGAETAEKYPFEQVMLRSVPQTVESLVVLQEAQFISPLSINLINGEDFQSFTDKVVFKNHRGKITGTKTLTGGANLTTLLISGNWNELRFPQDFYAINDPNILLEGLKSFEKLNSRHVQAEETVDGVSTLDLVSLSLPDEINSAWVFTGDVKILDDVFVENTVDGIIMESLLHQGLLSSKETRFDPNADVIFQGPVTIENLEVDSKINDKTSGEMFDNLILFDDNPQCLVPGNTKILCDTAFADMTLSDEKINGFPIANFLTKNSEQVINKPVTLSGPAFFQEMFAMDRIDGVLVQDVLDRALRVSSSTATSIPWKLNLEEIECKDNFRVEGSINGMKNYGLNVARTRGPPTQTFLGPIEIENPSFTKISTEQLTLDVGRTLQTMDVTKWSETRATLSEPASFSQSFTMNSALVKQNVETDNVNGIKVADLHDKVLRTDKDSQEFMGPVTIQKGIRVFSGDIRFHKTVDGLLLDDFIAHGFPLNARNDLPVVLRENWEFESLKLDKDLQIANNPCGVDLDRLQSDSVKRGDTNVEISGEKTFAQPLTISQDLTLPQLNGKMMDKLFSLHSEQDIAGHGKFTGNVLKNVLNAESINSLPLSWLSQMYSFENGKHIVNHDLVLRDSFNTDSLQVDGKVQGRDFNQVLANTWSLSDPNIAFTEEVTMEQPIVVEDDIESQVYNGIDLNELFERFISLDEDVLINQPVSFTQTVETEELLASGDVRAESFANGMDWNELMIQSVGIRDDNRDIIFTDAKFQHVIASSPVTVQTLNDVNFDNYVMLNTEQELGTLKILTAYVDGANVDLKGRLGSFDISDEFSDTLMNNQDNPQRLPGSTVIRGPVVIKENLDCFGPELKNQIITTREDLVLRSPVEFKSPLVVRKDVEIAKSIKGHSVESIFTNAFSTDSITQEISGLWEFQGPVIFKDNLSGEGLSHKMNIQSLIAEKEEELKVAERRVSEEKDMFVKRCESLQTLQKEISKYPLKLDSFDVHQVIGFQQEARHILAIEQGSTPSLLVQAKNCETFIYQWQPSTQLFTDTETLVSSTIGKVESWQSVPIGNHQSLVVLSQTPSDCSPLSGLQFLTISHNGVFSSVNMISSEDVKSFKLVKKDDTSQIVLFALFHNREQQVDVFQWSQGEFEKTGELQFNTEMGRVDATASSQGFGIVCQNNEAIHVYEYSTAPGNHRVFLEGSHPITSSGTGPMAVFQSFDLKYALVTESSSSPALIQPTCNFQVVRFQNGTVDAIQKLQVPEVLSGTHFQFANKQFVAFLSKSHGLFMYKFMGLNGFQPLNTNPFKVFGGIMLDRFSVTVSDFESPHPFILALSPNKVEVYRGNVIGDRMIASSLRNSCDI